MMSEQENTELIKKVYAAVKRADIQAVLEVFAEDVELQHPMPKSIWPWAGNRKGLNAFREFVNGGLQTIEYEQLEPREFIAQGDRVAVVLLERGRVKATGATYEIAEVHVFKIVAGKAVQVIVIEDTAPIIAALQGYQR